MDNEKDLLKKDLSNLETKKDVEQFVEDAELLGYEDIAELGKQKLKEISNKAESVGKTSESKISQINELGGSKDELQERTQEVDEEIKSIPEKATEKVGEVEGEDKKVVEGENKETEKEKLLKEFSEKLEKFHDEARKEYDGFIGERIKNYKQLVEEAHKAVEKGENGNLDEMIDLVKDYTTKNNSFSELNGKFYSVRPYSNGTRHTQIEAFEDKLYLKYHENIDNLKKEAEKQGIELPREKNINDTEDKLFHELIDIDKTEGPFMESLGQKKKEVEEKIKVQASEIMNNKMKELEKFEQDYKNMPEHQELAELEKQKNILWEKKTGVFFSENKKNEQLKEIENKMSPLRSKIFSFREQNNEIGNSLRDFEDKFKYVRGLMDEEKYKSLWRKLTSI